MFRTSQPKPVKHNDKFSIRDIYYFLWIAPRPILHVIILLLLSLLLIFKTGQGDEIFRIAFDNYLLRPPLSKVLYFIYLVVALFLFGLVIYVQCRKIYDVHDEQEEYSLPDYSLARIKEMEDWHAILWSAFPLVVLIYNYWAYFGSKAWIHVIVITIVLVIFLATALFKKKVIVSTTQQEEKSASEEAEVSTRGLSNKKPSAPTLEEVESAYFRNQEMMRARKLEKITPGPTAEEGPTLRGRGLSDVSPDNSPESSALDTSDLERKIAEQQAMITEMVNQQFIRFLDVRPWMVWAVVFGLAAFGTLMFLSIPFNTMILAFGGLMFWSSIASGIVILKWQLKFKDVPVFFLLLLLAIFFSKWNNNHNLRSNASEKVSDKTESIDKNFKKWLDLHVVEEDFFQDSIGRVYIFASEGGGIRSAYWTTGLLTRLHNEFPHLLKKTYAMSGVSGGSIGLATFNSIYHDQVIPQSGNTPEFKIDTNFHKEVLGKDMLSPLIGSMLSKDFIQRFLPFPIYSFDRARALEDSWSKYYREYLDKPTPNNTVLDLYDGDNKFKVPNLFFNSTRVETGSKSVVSNLTLDTTFFPKVNDITNISQSAYLLKSATFVSARFPYVTPVAKIYKDTKSEKKLWGLIVDGGYFDNTGLHTAMEIQEMMDSNLDSLMLDTSFTNPIKRRLGVESFTIKPTIIFFKNSKGTDDNMVPPMRRFYESYSPVQTFYNSWLSRAQNFRYDVEVISEEVDFDYTVFALPYELNGEEEDFPLGWSLSQRTQRNMDILIRKTATDTTNNIPLKSLQKWESNAFKQ